MNELNPLLWCLSAAILIDLYAGSWFKAGENFWLPGNILERLVERLCVKLDREERSSGTLVVRGLLGVAFMLGVTAGGGAILHLILASIPLGWVLELAILTTLISIGKPWRDSVGLASSLEVGSLEDSRRLLKELSDRDASYSDLTEITRVGIEATAGHFIFSFLGPVLSYLILGLPGILMYHGVTVFSRCQNASSNYLLCSRRLIAVMNWLLSWIAGTILFVCTFVIPTASAVEVLYQWRTFFSSSQKFKYGPAKLVIAAALGISLEGPRQYSEHLVERPYLGSGENPRPANLYLATRLILFSSSLIAVLIIIEELLLFLVRLLLSN